MLLFIEGRSFNFINNIWIITFLTALFFLEILKRSNDFTLSLHFSYSEFSLAFFKGRLLSLLLFFIQLSFLFQFLLQILLIFIVMFLFFPSSMFRLQSLIQLILWRFEVFPLDFLGDLNKFSLLLLFLWLLLLIFFNNAIVIILLFFW